MSRSALARSSVVAFVALGCRAEGQENVRDRALDLTESYIVEVVAKSAQNSCIEGTGGMADSPCVPEAQSSVGTSGLDTSDLEVSFDALRATMPFVGGVGNSPLHGGVGGPPISGGVGGPPELTLGGVDSVASYARKVCDLIHSVCVKAAACEGVPSDACNFDQNECTDFLSGFLEDASVTTVPAYASQALSCVDQQVSLASCSALGSDAFGEDLVSACAPQAALSSSDGPTTNNTLAE